MQRKSKIKIINNDASSFLIRHVLLLLVLVISIGVISSIIEPVIDSAKDIIPTDIFFEEK